MMKQLITMVDTNKFVIAVQAEEDVFKDFMECQQQFYKPFETKTIKIYHIFLSHQDKKRDLQYYKNNLI
jgi:rRNA-processing protein FCF1